MKKRITLMARFYRARSQYWRLQRIMFPSPAEVRFIELMGGKCVKIKRLRGGPNHYPFVYVRTLGKFLESQKFKREVRYGKYFVDFANDLNRIIEIDGHHYHMDVVADMDREIYIRNLCGWKWQQARIKRIPAFRLDMDPARVQIEVMNFVD